MRVGIDSPPEDRWKEGERDREIYISASKLCTNSRGAEADGKKKVLKGRPTLTSMRPCLWWPCRLWWFISTLKSVFLSYRAERHLPPKCTSCGWRRVLVASAKHANQPRTTTVGRLCC